MSLKREIGMIGLLFASVSGIIGSGWLFAPFFAAKEAGPAAIIAWVIGYILILLLAISFAEISTLFPVAGGVIRFIKFSHGYPSSFLISWLNWLSFVMVPAIEVQATLQYTAHFWPAVVQNTGHGHPLTGIGFGIAAILLIFFMLFNTIGIRYIIRLNTMVVWWKLIIPVIAIITLIVYRFNSHNFTASGGFSPMGWTGILSAVTAGGVIFSLTGFRQAIELAGEAKNPSKVLPIALIGSLSIALLIYVLLQVGFIGAMKPVDLAHGWGHLDLMGEAGPFVDIASMLGIIWLVGLLYLDAIVSPAGTALIFTASTARIVYAMSKAGIAPQIFTRTNKQGSPYVAIIINFIVGMLFFLPFPGWQSMVDFLASISVLAYAVGPVSMLAFRAQLPDKKRPFKVPVPFVIGSGGFIAAYLVVLWSGWHTVLYLCYIVAIGLVFLAIYFATAWRRKMDLFIHLRKELVSSLWVIWSVGFLAVMSYVGPFGGQKYISTGLDVGLTIIGAVIIFLMAYFTRLPDAIANMYLEKAVVAGDI
jgi:amino acid transporter